ncbi:MAG: DNA replication/repair protein RecF [Pseudomonadota bacterium]
MARLHLSLLALSHFRSHRLARLESDGRPVALHGPNGAGKTNLLEAVSLLSPGRGLRRAEAEALARRPEGLGWRVSARLAAPDGAHEVETGVEQPAQSLSRAVRIDGKAAPQTRLGALIPMLWLTPAMDRLWIEGAGERRRFLDRLTLAFDARHADHALAYEKAMRQRNRLLRDDVREPRWFDALEARMSDEGAALSAARNAVVARLARAQDGAETAFPAADLALTGEGPAAPEALREMWSRGRSRDRAAGRTLEGPHRADLAAVYADKGMEARLCSTGEQKALLISLVLAAARAQAEDRGAAPILLLDEVAAHLDEHRRAALYDEVCAVGAQAWMTGTGPELFEALGGRAMRVEVREESGASVVDVD